MLHKISQLCDKIDGLKKDADRLRKLKYGEPKGSVTEIDNLIAQIQTDCLLISRDRTPYEKLEGGKNDE
jgi:uncharacterized coiled-coil DUF342 family protein